MWLSECAFISRQSQHPREREWRVSYAVFAPAFSCFMWGRYSGLPGSLWENGPSGLLLHNPAPRSAVIVHLSINH
ncbi:Bgt-50573 [Blumeria graminis f. sp. tritici]|uniref:Bgt-50573 n=1 Tax=Blumeria graminis f. sp. tritici TaxID=62690 RepID=A0A9X9MHK6_BLUGR|nr:Bgt-50573 [Blumeria graminis f. sp. tritici]